MNKILAICGSTRKNSSNSKLLKYIKDRHKGSFDLDIFESIDTLPHFNPDSEGIFLPAPVLTFRKLISEADGIVICTPEYVFSLPGSLKNALEWCVATTIFTDKPLALIIASASGEKAQEELSLIMKTLQARFNKQTELLIKGIKAKINEENIITDPETEDKLTELIRSFQLLIKN